MRQGKREYLPSYRVIGAQIKPGNPMFILPFSEKALCLARISTDVISNWLYYHDPNINIMAGAYEVGAQFILTENRGGKHQP